MGVFLIVIGLGWAAMGVANIVMGLQNTGFGTSGFEAEWASLNLMVSMGFFILPGLVVAGIGESLRRSAIRRDQQATPARPEPLTTRNLRKCPFCAELIQVEASLCKHCHSDVEPEVAPPSPPLVVPKTDGVLWLSCSSCGQGNIPKSRSTCPVCGQPFVQA